MNMGKRHFPILFYLYYKNNEDKGSRLSRGFCSLETKKY